jgi:hypothetical protein
MFSKGPSSWTSSFRREKKLLDGRLKKNKRNDEEGYHKPTSHQYSTKKSAVFPVTFRPTYLRNPPSAEREFFQRRSSSAGSSRDPTRALLSSKNLQQQASSTRPKQSSDDDFDKDYDDDSYEIKFDDDDNDKDDLDDDRDFEFDDEKKPTSTTTTSTTSRPTRKATAATPIPSGKNKEDVERRFFAPVNNRRNVPRRPFRPPGRRPPRNRATTLGDVPLAPPSLNDVDTDANGSGNNPNLSLLGSGNFEVITGGLFGGSDYEDDPNNADEFGDGYLGAKQYPYRQRATPGGYRRRQRPHSRIHPNDILSNFRDFAEIHYRGSLSQDSPVVAAPEADLMAVDS